MLPTFLRRGALLGLFAGVAVSVLTAQDSGALIDVLVRKGILSDQEAEEVRAELSAQSHAAMVGSIAGGKSTHSISIAGRLQVQYAGIDGDGTLPSTQNFMIRRMYFGPTAHVGAHWSAQIMYDFAGNSWDKAIIEWAGRWGDQAILLDFGIRKVNYGLDEYTSSGSIRAIERAGVTRYFVESNNGRRLGAGSYHVGAFLEGNPDAFKGRATGWFYGAAITDPERPDNFEDASSAGSAATNQPAYWANLGYTQVLGEGRRVTAGVAGGFLPDQGGKVIGVGDDATVYGAYVEYQGERLSLTAEWLGADLEQGAGVGRDAQPWGFWVQPALLLTDRLEAVARVSYVDSDERGIRVSDAVRSAPAALTGDNLTEYYLGFNVYLVGNDLKLQLGYVRGTAQRGATDETAHGVRSQLQVQF